MQSVHVQSGPNGTSVLNQALLNQYRARKSNLLERLINAYLEEAPKSFQAMRRAVEGGNLDDLRMNAHALKSSSYNLGAMRLSKLCQDIETAAIARDTAGIDAGMARIGPECFDVEQALSGELYQLKQVKVAATARVAVAASIDDDWN